MAKISGNIVVRLYLLFNSGPYSGLLTSTDIASTNIEEVYKTISNINNSNLDYKIVRYDNMIEYIEPGDTALCVIN
jgi:hypothetical protein